MVVEAITTEKIWLLDSLKVSWEVIEVSMVRSLSHSVTLRVGLRVAVSLWEGLCVVEEMGMVRSLPLTVSLAVSLRETHRSRFFTNYLQLASYFCLANRKRSITKRMEKLVWTFENLEEGKTTVTHTKELLWQLGPDSNDGEDQL